MGLTIAVQKASTNSVIDTLIVGDSGPILFIFFGEDISAATSLTLEVEKPGGTTESWDGAPLEIYQQSYLRYEIQDGDLDEAGIYKIQPAFTLGDFVGSWPIVTICVNPKIVVSE